jgi:hypothetical protein
MECEKMFGIVGLIFVSKKTSDWMGLKINYSIRIAVVENFINEDAIPNWIGSV